MAFLSKLPRLNVPSENSIVDWARPQDVPPQPMLQRPTKIGLNIALLFFGGFGAWSAFAPIDSAAVATGEIRVESHHRTVANLEGGVVKDILIHDGDRVAAGQVLVRLSSIDSLAARKAFQDQQSLLLALQARLTAERNDSDRVAFPPLLLARQANDRPAADAIAAQANAFENRRRELKEAVGQYEAENRGHRAQIAALDTQIGLFNAEIRDVRILLDQGLSTRPKLSALERDVASAQGQKGAEIAAISRSEQAARDYRDKRGDEIQSELSDTQAKLAEIEGKLKAASDVDTRKAILAPAAGRIVGLKAFTPGGVILPGAPILDIVRDSDLRIVEAHIQPRDIEAIHVGLRARVILTGYRRRITPTLNATVITVSPDALVMTDSPARTEYYSAEIAIDPKDLARSTEHLVLYPGMPVEVMIVTGKRTLLEYMLQPVADSFARAFRES